MDSEFLDDLKYRVDLHGGTVVVEKHPQIRAPTMRNSFSRLNVVDVEERWKGDPVCRKISAGRIRRVQGAGHLHRQAGLNTEPSPITSFQTPFTVCHSTQGVKHSVFTFPGPAEKFTSFREGPHKPNIYEPFGLFLYNKKLMV